MSENAWVLWLVAAIVADVIVIVLLVKALVWLVVM